MMLLRRTQPAETILSEETLKAIANELVNSVRRNTSIDWQLKESVRAKMGTLIKHILCKYKYSPDDPNRRAYNIPHKSFGAS